jgi:hypothetical protein
MLRFCVYQAWCAKGEVNDMLNPMIHSELCKVQQDHIVLEILKSRIPRALGRANPRLHERLFARLGDLLVSAGSRLQERYEPAMVPGPRAHHSPAK